MKAFDIVEAVVREKALASHGAFQIDENKLDVLSSYCKVIDGMLDDFFGESFTVDVTEDHLVRIDIEIFSFVYEKKFKPDAYTEILKRAISVRFTKTGECSVKMSMVFPSLYK